MIVEIYAVIINLFNLILFELNSLRHLMSGGLTVNSNTHKSFIEATKVYLFCKYDKKKLL